MVKKIVLIVLGLFALVGGALIAAVGVAALVLGGRSGIIHSDYHHLSTTTSAFVSDPARLRDNANADLRSGTATLRLDARETPKNLFLGVGPSAQVTAYLAGTSYEEITNLGFSPFTMTTTRVVGTTIPAAPADQTFWVASASGSRPSLSWDIANGDYRVVVMNSDGSPVVVTDARVGLKIPALFGIGLGATIGGGLFALLGLGLLIWGIAARRKPRVAPAPAGYGYPGSSPYPPATPYTAAGPAGPGGLGGSAPTGYGTGPGYGTPPGTGPGYGTAPGTGPGSGAPPGPEPGSGPYPPSYTPSTPSTYPGGYPGGPQPPYRPPTHGATDPTADPTADPNQPTSGMPSDGSGGGWRPR
jgi:hypothetical protein